MLIPLLPKLFITLPFALGLWKSLQAKTIMLFSRSPAMRFLDLGPHKWKIVVAGLSSKASYPGTTLNSLKVSTASRGPRTAVLVYLGSRATYSAALPLLLHSIGRQPCARILFLHAPRDFGCAHTSWIS